MYKFCCDKVEDVRNADVSKEFHNTLERNAVNSWVIGAK